MLPRSRWRPPCTRQLALHARTIAVVEPSLDPSHPSARVIDYLKRAGFDVVPIRRDRAEVLGRRAHAALDEVPGAIDLVLFYGPRGSQTRVIEEAARKGVEAVWLGPGLATREAEERARALSIGLVKDRDPVAELRSMLREAGRPPKLGVHAGDRKRRSEQDRARRRAGGYVEAGGGGRRGGGGGRAAIDERKMVTGPPSRRRRRGRRRKAA